MSDPIIRGSKLPLAWSTFKITGYIVESGDEENSSGEQLIEDEDAAYVTQISGIQHKTEVTIEVIPLSDVEEDDLPAGGDVFTYGSKSITVLNTSVKRSKGNAMKWTIKGNRMPGVPLD